MRWPKTLLRQIESIGSLFVFWRFWMCALYSLLSAQTLLQLCTFDFLTSRQLQQTQAAKQTWATDTGHKSVVVSWMRKAATCENSDVGSVLQSTDRGEKSAFRSLGLTKTNGSINGMSWPAVTAKFTQIFVIKELTIRSKWMSPTAVYTHTDSTVPLLLFMRAAALWCSGSSAYLKWMLCQSLGTLNKDKAAVALENAGTGRGAISQTRRARDGFTEHGAWGRDWLWPCISAWGLTDTAGNATSFTPVCSGHR